MANDSPYALSASVWTKDVDRGAEVASGSRPAPSTSTTRSLNLFSAGLPTPAGRPPASVPGSAALGLRKYCRRSSRCSLALPPTRSASCTCSPLYTPRMTRLIGRFLRSSCTAAASARRRRRRLRRSARASRARSRRRPRCWRLCTELWVRAEPLGDLPAPTGRRRGAGPAPRAGRPGPPRGRAAAWAQPVATASGRRPGSSTGRTSSTGTARAGARRWSIAALWASRRSQAENGTPRLVAVQRAGASRRRAG